MEPPDTLVLVHGFASSFEQNWRASGWVDILADFGCSAPRIDLPGHGGSGRPTDPSAYATLAELLYSQLAQPTSAVGFSAGAELLLRVAVAHPDCFERLALLGVGDDVFERGPAGAAGVLATALERSVEPEDVRGRLLYRLAHAPGNDPQALAAFLRRPREPIRPEELSAVTCPVLVVRGDRDTTATGADRLVEALPSASLVSVPGVDHFATPADVGVIDATLRFFGLV